MQKKRTKKKLRFAGAPAQTESSRIDASRKIILEKKRKKKAAGDGPRRSKREDRAAVNGRRAATWNVAKRRVAQDSRHLKIDRSLPAEEAHHLGHWLRVRLDLDLFTTTRKRIETVASTRALVLLTKNQETGGKPCRRCSSNREPSFVSRSRFHHFQFHGCRLGNG